MSALCTLAVCITALAQPLTPATPTVTCCGEVVAATATCAEEAPALDRIKALAGEWVQVDQNGQPTDTVISRIRVTAGGSAVHETLFPGTDMEMITLYHMDGNDLILKHYCMLGNQPRMVARSISDDRIVFVCDGTGIESKDEAHMHQGTIQFVGKDHLKTEYLQHKDGEVVYTAAFDVVRR